MSTDQAKIERVMQRIGVWKTEQKCNTKWTPMKLDSCPRCGRTDIPWRIGTLQGEYCEPLPHDIPCPDPSDPAIVVAMIEWQTSEYDVPMFDEESRTTMFVPDQHHTEIWFGEDNLWHARIDHWAETGTAPTLHAALIDAIDALPKEN
jgi:hypothetical protein